MSFQIINWETGAFYISAIFVPQSNKSSKAYLMGIGIIGVTKPP